MMANKLDENPDASDESGALTLQQVVANAEYARKRTIKPTYVWKWTLFPCVLEYRRLVVVSALESPNPTPRHQLSKKWIQKKKREENVNIQRD